MNKTKKTFLFLSGLIPLTLPLIAASCKNTKSDLQNQINLSRQLMLSFEYEDFKNELRAEIDNAEKVLNNKDSSNKNYSEAAVNLKKKTEEVSTKVSNRNNKHISNKDSVTKKINQLKQYAHEELSETKYNSLKQELVKKYQEFEVIESSRKIADYTDENTKKTIDELEKKLNEIKKKKENLDKPKK